MCAASYAPDVRYVLSDRIERRGRDLYAELLAADFEDGVTAAAARDPRRARSRSSSSARQPAAISRCTARRLTQVHFHNGGVTHRIATRYSTPGHA